MAHGLHIPELKHVHVDLALGDSRFVLVVLLGGGGRPNLPICVLFGFLSCLGNRALRLCNREREGGLVGLDGTEGFCGRVHEGLISREGGLALVIPQVQLET